MQCREESIAAFIWWVYSLIICLHYCVNALIMITIINLFTKDSSSNKTSEKIILINTAIKGSRCNRVRFNCCHSISILSLFLLVLISTWSQWLPCNKVAVITFALVIMHYRCSHNASELALTMLILFWLLTWIWFLLQVWLILMQNFSICYHIRQIG